MGLQYEWHRNKEKKWKKEDKEYMNRFVRKGVDRKKEK